MSLDKYPEPSSNMQILRITTTSSLANSVHTYSVLRDPAWQSFFFVEFRDVAEVAIIHTSI